VKQHSEETPLFQRHGVEDQLSAMYQPVVQLKSGGYLVINPTEALVSIDINSGRSTREYNIEQTAFSTNIEAAAEIARQLRLRDMAGLIVIDFIDMEQQSHVRKVEKAMKEALKNDRARIQVGRISSFGLMEMSRQRLRTGVLEASTKPCPHCEGTGLMRTASSAGLSALRLIEDEAARGRGSQILLRAGRDAAVYLLNKKRSELAEIEGRYGVFIEVVIDDAFEGAKMAVESSGPRPQRVIPAPQPIEAEAEIDDEEEEEELEAALGETEESEDRGDEEGEGNRQGRKRRRRRRGGRNRRRGGGESAEGAALADEVPPAIEETPAEPEQASEEAGAAEKPKRRRRRRGGGARSESADVEVVAAEVAPDSSPMVEQAVDEEPPAAMSEPEPEQKPKKGGRRKKSAEPAEAPSQEAVPAAEPEEKPKRRTRKTKASETPPVDGAESPGSAPPPSADNDSAAEQDGEPRRGWWQRTFG